MNKYLREIYNFFNLVTISINKPTEMTLYQNRNENFIHVKIKNIFVKLDYENETLKKDNLRKKLTYFTTQ